MLTEALRDIQHVSKICGPVFTRRCTYSDHCDLRAVKCRFQIISEFKRTAIEVPFYYLLETWLINRYLNTIQTG